MSGPRKSKDERRKILTPKKFEPGLLGTKTCRYLPKKDYNIICFFYLFFLEGIWNIKYLIIIQDNTICETLISPNHTQVVPQAFFRARSTAHRELKSTYAYQ